MTRGGQDWLLSPPQSISKHLQMLSLLFLCHPGEAHTQGISLGSEPWGNWVRVPGRPRQSPCRTRSRVVPGWYRNLGLNTSNMVILSGLQDGTPARTWGPAPGQEPVLLLLVPTTP